MSEEHVIDTFEYKGFTVKILPDLDADEPYEKDDEEIFLSAREGGGFRSYSIGREGYHTAGESHIPWGEGKWGAFGKDIPEDAWEGGGREAYEMYQEWKEQFDPSYVVYPIRCGDAHGPGSFQIWEVDVDEDPDRIEGYVFIKVPVGDLERLADTRDLEKMKDAIIEAYEQWSNGDIYGYVITDSDGEDIEDGSCWNYYGMEYCQKSAKECIDSWGSRYDKKVTLVVTRKDYTWERREVMVPLWVGANRMLDWARENLGLDDDDSVEEYFVASKAQVPLFPEREEHAE